MKNRILSLLVAVVIMISAVPVFTVSAAAGGFTIDGYGVLVYYTGSGGDVVIPDGVTRIDAQAFGLRASLITSVIIPDGVTSIGAGAFMGCSNLTEITIPESVTSIEMGAFNSCKNLSKISIPDGITSMGHSVFNNTAWLNEQANGVVYIKKVAYLYKGDMPKNTSITLKPDTKIIAGRAFYNFDGLTEIIIPDSVKTIGIEAFNLCKNLTEITIPDGVTDIEESAFSDCKGLTSITIPDSVKSIGNKAFYNCTNISTIEPVPDGLISLGRSAFVGTKWLADQPDGVVYAGKFAYSYKGKMPENTSLTLREDTKGIADSAFNDDNLIQITIPESVTHIGMFALSSCDGLTEITIPDSVTRIGDSAFSGCKNLAEIKIGNGVTSIGAGAFELCRSLTEITIPDGVTSIENKTLLNCESITSITLGSGVTSIADTGIATCPKLTTLTFKSRTLPTIKTVHMPVSTFLHGCSVSTVYVHFGSKAAYQSVSYFSAKNIVEIKCNDPACPSCTRTTSSAKGHILGNPEIAIFDALEILKYLVGMDGAIKDGNDAFNAALITGDSDKPTIFDALEILKYLVNMPSKVN